MMFQVFLGLFVLGNFGVLSMYNTSYSSMFENLSYRAKLAGERGLSISRSTHGSVIRTANLSIQVQKVRVVKLDSDVEAFFTIIVVPCAITNTPKNIFRR